MKKIYYLMCLLPLMPLVSACEDDEAEVVRLHYQDTPAVSVESISPEYGYAGDQLTVTGTNFGGGVDFVKVFIGEKEAEVLSCTDTQIKAIVPDDATTGVVSVQFMGQEIPTELSFRVMGKPSVMGMRPTFGDKDETVVWAFAGGEVTFLGTELGGSEDDIDVRFGKSATSAEVVSWSENEFTVKVPEDATSGDITLNIGSCHNVNVPYDTPEKDVFRLVSHASVTKVTPAQGYKGSSITLIGIGLADARSVMFGDKAGTFEVVRRIGDDVPGGKATEDTLAVKTPSDLSENTEYAINIRTAFETVEEAAMFTVSPDATNFKAGTDGGNALGYVGNRITISGDNMPADTETMQVLFGDKEAEIENYENGVLTVVIPADATTGKNQTLTLVYAGREFMVSNAFNVKEGPVIESSDVAVFAGGTMTIKGKYLNADGLTLTVTLDGTEITRVTNGTGTELSFTIPSETGYMKDATVVLDYGDVIEPIELKVDVIPNETDITQYILQNYKASFEIEGSNLKGWSTGGNYNNGNPYYLDEATGYYWLAMNGKDNTWRASLYQSSKLPKGKYKFTITASGQDQGGGRNVAFFAVLDGADAIFPELSDSPKPGHFVSEEGILGKVSIKEAEYVVGTHTCEIELNESSDVTIGFAFMLANSRYLYISEIKIEKE